MSSTAAQSGKAGLDAAWQVLSTVLDPEVPVLSVCDLGLVRDIRPYAGGLDVVLTPTYSGCPATEVIGDAVRDALDAAGLGPARVVWQRSPAWTTDWISEDGLRKLHEYGIAPPGRCAGADEAQPVRLHLRHPRTLACPRCGSLNTECLSAFGSTACKALHRCLDCREPFEHFKPI
jgi:ring-1,2-phenylacetyl-CoA epoxidase subunit PaaD